MSVSEPRLPVAAPRSRATRRRSRRSGSSKRFGCAGRAGRRVAEAARAGSLHALLGENGAGKSTLVKCVMGYYQADDGRVLVGGVEAPINNPRDARGAGHRHGLSALHAGRQHDRRREPGAVAARASRS